jgi:uncharacterized protein (DUF1330 family)
MGVVHSISDAEAFGAYQQVAEPTLAKYGGKMVLLSSGVEAGDGDWSPMGIVLFEFKSGRQARKWYNSPEYQAIVGQRLASTDSNTVFIDVA